MDWWWYVVSFFAGLGFGYLMPFAGVLLGVYGAVWNGVGELDLVYFVAFGIASTVRLLDIEDAIDEVRKVCACEE